MITAGRNGQATRRAQDGRVTTSDAPIRRLAALTLLVAGCRQGAPAPGATETSAALAAMAAACASDSLRPVAAAPAAGLWVGQRRTPATRVVAMVGQVTSDVERPLITRRVETLELRAGADSIRLSNDTASVRLELLPPFSGAGGSQTGRSEPAAAYALGPRALIASYEPCAGAGEPRLRYLRRDARGAVTTDLMLRRESAETRGIAR